MDSTRHSPRNSGSFVPVSEPVLGADDCQLCNFYSRSLRAIDLLDETDNKIKPSCKCEARVHESCFYSRTGQQLDDIPLNTPIRVKQGDDLFKKITEYYAKESPSYVSPAARTRLEEKIGVICPSCCTPLYTFVADLAQKKESTPQAFQQEVNKGLNAAIKCGDRKAAAFWEKMGGKVNHNDPYITDALDDLLEETLDWSHAGEFSTWAGLGKTIPAALRPRWKQVLLSSIHKQDHDKTSEWLIGMTESDPEIIEALQATRDKVDPLSQNQWQQLINDVEKPQSHVAIFERAFNTQAGGVQSLQVQPSPSSNTRAAPSVKQPEKTASSLAIDELINEKRWSKLYQLMACNVSFSHDQEAALRLALPEIARSGNYELLLSLKSSANFEIDETTQNLLNQALIDYQGINTTAPCSYIIEQLQQLGAKARTDGQPHSDTPTDTQKAVSGVPDDPREKQALLELSQAIYQGDEHELARLLQNAPQLEADYVDALLLYFDKASRLHVGADSDPTDFAIIAENKRRLAALKKQESK